MEHMNYSASAISSPALPTQRPQDTGSFRKLVERKITIDEYVRDLDRRTQELREGATPRKAESA